MSSRRYSDRFRSQLHDAYERKVSRLADAAAEREDAAAERERVVEAERKALEEEKREAERVHKENREVSEGALFGVLVVVVSGRGIL